MMLLEKISQNLTTVISEVLETMFFVFLEPQSGTLPSSKDFIGAKVVIKGTDSAYEIDFLAQSRLLQQIAADFLGLDQETANLAQCQDVLKEIGNMVAGNLVNICDPEACLELGIPTVSGEGLAAESLNDCAETFIYGSDEGVLLVGLNVADTSGK
ncbi:MAG: chemotaxis protein CheX [Deltaproteobacteria bacterium]|nr:chemotaxis protein CheX [Candidatus Tharpella aukensis]